MLVGHLVQVALSEEVGPGVGNAEEKDLVAHPATGAACCPGAALPSRKEQGLKLQGNGRLNPAPPLRGRAPTATVPSPSSASPTLAILVPVPGGPHLIRYTARTGTAPS
jgi:hypothetical protein